MPHYADGTQARIGDQVVGVPYNTKGKQIVGTIVGIIPNTDACNVRVAYLDPIDPANTFASHCFIYRHGHGHEPIFLEPKFDYGAVKDFTFLGKVGRDVKVDGSPANLPRDSYGALVRIHTNVDTTYGLYRERNGKREGPFGLDEAIEIEDGDEFFCVPPATY